MMVTAHVSPDDKHDMSGRRGTAHVRTSEEYHSDYQATTVWTQGDTVRTLHTEAQKN